MDRPNKFKARAIIEVMGAPVEHATKAMASFMKKLDDEEDIDMKEGKVHKPKPVGKLFSLYSELELEFKNFEALTHFCFEYMPSSIEITDPAEFKLEASQYSSIINDLMAKLHDVDMKFKHVNARSQVIDQNAMNMMKNAVLIAIREEPKTLIDLSRQLGIEPKQLEKFLENFIKDGHFKKEGDLYAIK